MPLDRCGFQLERETCLYSTCGGSGWVPVPLPRACLERSVSPARQSRGPSSAGRGGKRHLPRGPCGHRSLQPRAKRLRETGVDSREQPAASGASPRAGGRASGGASAPSLSLTRSEPSWTLRAPLPRASHPDWLPRIQSAAPQQKISLYRDSSNTSQGKPDVK